MLKELMKAMIEKKKPGLMEEEESPEKDVGIMAIHDPKHADEDQDKKLIAAMLNEEENESPEEKAAEMMPKVGNKANLFPGGLKDEIKEEESEPEHSDMFKELLMKAFMKKKA